MRQHVMRIAAGCDLGARFRVGKKTFLSPLVKKLAS
jgi:hypothetical protein